MKVLLPGLKAVAGRLYELSKVRFVLYSLFSGYYKMYRCEDNSCTGFVSPERNSKPHKIMEEMLGY